MDAPLLVPESVFGGQLVTLGTQDYRGFAGATTRGSGSSTRRSGRRNGFSATIFTRMKKKLLPDSTSSCRPESRSRPSQSSRYQPCFRIRCPTPTAAFHAGVSSAQKESRASSNRLRARRSPQSCANGDSVTLFATYCVPTTKRHRHTSPSTADLRKQVIGTTIDNAKGYTSSSSACDTSQCSLRASRVKVFLRCVESKAG